LVKENSNLLCLCGARFSSDDSEYYCENCKKIRFPRYNENGETDLITALSSISKDNVTVLEESLTIGQQVDYVYTIYTFIRSGQEWLLKDVSQKRKVWINEDPQKVSDEILVLKKTIGADLNFPL